LESWIAKTGKGLSDGLIYEAEARLPDGVSVAGRGLQPVRNLCRGLTEHCGRGCKPRPAERQNIADGVANPVRQRGLPK